MTISTYKERFDSCIKIVELAYSRRRDRENFEWKLSIAFWTLIVLAIARPPEILSGNPYVQIAAAIAALLLYLIFAVGVHSAHKADSDRAKHFLSRAIEKLPDSVGLDTKDRRWSIIKPWGLTFQLGTTVLLVLAFPYPAIRNLLHPALARLFS